MNHTEKLYKKFVKTFQEHYSISQEFKILIGISGGPDSTLLVYFFKRYADEYKHIQLHAAYYMHQWPSHENEEAIELKLCENLCKKFNVSFIADNISHALSHKLKRNSGSLEGVAREKRRAFLEYVADSLGCSYIALGHHQDDQIETFFIRLIRGSSLQGLSCMRYQNQRYIRPLLNFTKLEILQVLEEQKLPYHEDTCNKDLLKLRSGIRNTVIPALVQCDQRSLISLSETIRKLQESSDSFDAYITSIYTKVYDDATQTLDTNLFLKLDVYMQKQLLTKILFHTNFTGTFQESLLNEILRFLSFGSGTHTIGILKIHKKKDNKVCFLNVEKV